MGESSPLRPSQGLGRPLLREAPATPLGAKRVLRCKLRKRLRCSSHGVDDLDTREILLIVRTTHPFASPIAAMIVSSALRGRPLALPSAISRAQMGPASSSNTRMRCLKRACGPSGPENHDSGHGVSCQQTFRGCRAGSRRGSGTR